MVNVEGNKVVFQFFRPHAKRVHLVGEFNNWRENELAMTCDDKGYWQQIETYIAEHSKTEVSHGLCPDCVKKLYPDIHRQLLAEQEAAGGPNPNP